jgi:hypothetical protein
MSHLYQPAAAAEAARRATTEAAMQMAAEVEERMAADWASKNNAMVAEAKTQELRTTKKIAALEKTVAAAVQTVADAPETQRAKVLSKQMSIIQQQQDSLKNILKQAEKEQVEMSATIVAHNAVFNALSGSDMDGGTRKNRKRTKKHKKKRGKKTRSHRSKRYKR